MLVGRNGLRLPIDGNSKTRLERGNVPPSVIHVVRQLDQLQAPAAGAHHLDRKDHEQLHADLSLCRAGFRRPFSSYRSMSATFVIPVLDQTTVTVMDHNVACHRAGAVVGDSERPDPDSPFAILLRAHHEPS